MNQDKWWQQLEMIAIELYPKGPNENAIWSRAGGDLANLSFENKGQADWHRAIGVLRNGGGGKNITPESLLNVMKLDYPRNKSLAKSQQLNIIVDNIGSTLGEWYTTHSSNILVDAKNALSRGLIGKTLDMLVKWFGTHSLWSDILQYLDEYYDHFVRTKLLNRKINLVATYLNVADKLKFLIIAIENNKPLEIDFKDLVMLEPAIHYVKENFKEGLEYEWETTKVDEEHSNSIIAEINKDQGVYQIENKKFETHFSSVINVPKVRYDEPLLIELGFKFRPSSQKHISPSIGIDWGRQDKDNRYSFLVRQDRRFKVSYWEKGVERVIVNWAFFLPVDEYAGMNELKITLVKGSTWYYINNTFVFQCNFDRPLQGRSNFGVEINNKVKADIYYYNVWGLGTIEKETLA